MGKEKTNLQFGTDESGISDLTEVKLFVPEETARAWQRCTWIIAYETGRKRTDIMAEMVHDFLLKYEC